MHRVRPLSWRIGAFKSNGSEILFTIFRGALKMGQDSRRENLHHYVGRWEPNGTQRRVVKTFNYHHLVLTKFPFKKETFFGWESVENHQLEIFPFVHENVHGSCDATQFRVIWKAIWKHPTCNIEVFFAWKRKILNKIFASFHPRKIHQMMMMILENRRVANRWRSLIIFLSQIVVFVNK